MINVRMLKKILIIILLIVSFQFIVNIPAYAADNNVLLGPVLELFARLGDGIMNIMQKTFMGMDASGVWVNNDNNTWLKILTAVIAITIAIVAVVATIYTGGWSLTVAYTALGAVVKTLAVGAVAYFAVSVTHFGEGGFFLPEFELTPQAIFKNEIVAFDVNFFNPKKIEKYTDRRDVLSQTFLTPSSYTHKCLTDYNYIMDTVEEEYVEYYPFWYWMNDDEYQTFQKEYGFFDRDAGYSGETRVVGKSCACGLWSIDTEDRASNEREWTYNGKTYRVHYSYHYDFFQGNRYGIFLFREVELGDFYTVELEPETSVAYDLQSTISAWYTTFRNIALVALLSILVYIGIRITLSSVASEKAKYKQMITDWVVAICLVFLMHYIMSFAVYINEKIIDAVSSITVASYGGEKGVLGNEQPTIEKTDAKSGEYDQQVNEECEIKDAGVQLFIITGDDAKHAYDILVGDNKNVVTDGNGNVISGENSLYKNRFSKGGTTLYWKANDFMTQARILGQQIEVDKDGKEINEDQTEGERAGYNIIYIVLVIYTVIFCFTYLKRVIYMAFLTIIAPLVAITYPIDKINDGKAQAFDLWLKEYIFNLLIQPVHLILYTILIGSAMKFATKNIFYVVVALGFLTPAEKLLRRFFGFEKAQTPGAFGGATGAALMMSALGKLTHPKPPKGRLNSGQNDSKDDEEEEKNKPRMNKKIEDTENIFGNDGKNRTTNNEDDEDNEDNEDESRIRNKDEEYNDYDFDFDSKENQGDKPGKYKDSNGSSSNKNGSKSTQKNKGRPKRKKSVIRGIKRGVKSYGGTLIKRNKENGGILRKGLRMAGGVAGAATLATAGGLIGIASGDPSKAAQYIATGATGGYAFGKSTVDNVSNKVKTGTGIAKEVGKEAKKGYYGDEYREHEQEKYKKQFRKNQENLRKIEESFSVEENEAKEIAKRIAEYTDYEGVNSVEDAIAVEKLIQEENYKPDEALRAAGYNNVALEGKNTNHMKHKDLEEYRKTLMKRLMQKGMTEEDSRIYTAKLFEAMNSFNEYKN